MNHARPITVAMLVPDNRQEFGRWNEPAPLFGPAPTALIAGLAGRNDCQIHILSCVKRNVQSPEKLAENIFYHSLYVGPWGWLRSAYLGCTLAIRKKLRQINPDIVHGQGTERNSALSAAFSGRPNLITIHGNMRSVARVLNAPFGSYYWLAARLESLAVSRAGGVICLSSYSRSQAAASARRIWLIPNAVNPFFFDAIRRPAPEKIILCVANIEPYKNQIWLVDALAPLARQIPFQLRFLGRVPEGSGYGAAFKQRIANEPWCRHDGFADVAALRAQMEQASMLILPSLEDNCPMVLLEAMAAGLPVVASRAGGIPDFIQDSRTGCLFNPGDASLLRQHVANLLGNSILATQISAEARKMAQSRHHPSVIADSHLSAYRELLSS